jgi:N-acylneuraminate cytidylyltransferase
MLTKKIIAIIPARGGSKGLPRKNIKLFNGKPLIAYTIEVALASEYIERIFVSTNDKEIADISRKYKAEVIMRPDDISKDNSLRKDAIKHVIKTLKTEMKYSPEIIVYLQPTSPLRTVKDLDSALEMYLNNDCDSVVSVCESKDSPYWSLIVKHKYIEPLFGWEYFTNMRRQDLPTTFILNGAIYITSVIRFLENNNLFSRKTLPYKMPIGRSVDIDDEFDFKLAEWLIINKNGE